jgi:hypothetical protein
VTSALPKKVGTVKKDTMFSYKDGTSISIATADVKTLVKVSNDIVNSGQVGTIFSKKFAHAEAIVDELPAKERELHDSDSDDEEEDGEDTDSSVGEEEGEGCESSVGDDGIASTGEEVEHQDGDCPSADNTDDTEANANLQGGSTSTPNLNFDNGSHASAPENPITTSDATVALSESPRPSSDDMASVAGATATPSLPGVVQAAAPPGSSERFPLSNPMTTALDLPPPPPAFEATDKDENVSEYMMAVRDAQEKMRKSKTQLKLWKKAKLESSGKRALKKRLEEQLKVVKMEVKVEAAATKQETQLPPHKHKRGDESESDDDDNGDDDFGFEPKKMKRILTAVDKWQKGHRKAALAAASNKLVQNVTVTSWEGAYENMFEHGFAVVDDWTTLLSPECRPTQEQRDYILQRKYLGLFLLLRSLLNVDHLICHATLVPEDCKETIFEGVQFLDNSSFVDAHYDRIQEVAMQQMKQVQGSQKEKWKAYQARYGPQVDEIIQGCTQYDRTFTATDEARHSKAKKNTRSSAAPPQPLSSGDNETPPQVVKHVPGMFTGKKAGIATNWKTGYTSLLNGTGYQHPHADAGRPD